MTERTNVPVLKTGVGLPTVGSNPTPSATPSATVASQDIGDNLSGHSRHLVSARPLVAPSGVVVLGKRRERLRHPRRCVAVAGGRESL